MSKFIIEIRTKGFGKAETEIKRVSEQTRKFARDSNNASNAGATFRKEVSQLRNNMLLYAFAIGGTITALGRFVKAASDAREQASKFNVVFGDFAPATEEFAQSITDSFGIAKSEMIGLLASLQDTFVPLGFSREHAARLSQSIAQLSMDVGSFNNVATGDVAQRFTSAIIGNHEAVRSLGISLTEATIKQEAYRLGLAETGTELDQTAKVLSRMSIIYNNTTDAQGDLVRTQDEFANRLRGVQGQLTEMTETMGKMLMPFAEFALTLTSVAIEGNRAAFILYGLSAAVVTYAGKAAIATAQTIALTGAMSKNIFILLGTGFVMAIDLAMEKIEEFAEGTVAAQYGVQNLGDLVVELADSNVTLTGSTEETTKALEDQLEAIQKHIQSLRDSESGLQARLAVMKEDTELGKAAARAYYLQDRQLTELEVSLLEQIDALNAKNEADKEAARIAKEKAKADKESEKRMVEMASSTAQINQEAIRIQAELDGAHELTLEKMDIVEQGARELASAMQLPYKDVIGQVTNFTEELSLENFQLDISNETHKALAEAIINVTNQKLALAQATNDATQEEKNNAQSIIDSNKAYQKQQQELRLVASGILSIASALKQASDESMTFDQQFSLALQTAGALLMMVPGGQVGGAFLQASSMFVGHTGGLIKNSGIQRFATGGMVQGQDNVPIMAQAGEFIMQRSAVQNIGVENLAAMNSGQSNGGVTVNIQGNMVGNKSFVRDVMLPEIQKSINRA
tara:strand:+ start:271 stop:2505 length:2235 start_codon:yes stop_codon:yes gene_type:complete